MMPPSTQRSNRSTSRSKSRTHSAKSNSRRKQRRKSIVIKDGAEPAPEGTIPIMLSLREMEEWNLLPSNKPSVPNTNDSYEEDGKTAPSVSENSSNNHGNNLRLTNLAPFYWISRAEMLENLKKAGKLSPFHPAKKPIEKYKDGDELLLVVDSEQKYGDNFLLCIKQSAAEHQISLIKEREDAEIRRQAEIEAELRRKQEEIERKKREEEEMLRRTIEEAPITPRPFQTVTMSSTVAQTQKISPKPSRPKICFRVQKSVQDFGSKCSLNNRDADIQLTEFRNRKDPNFDLQASERDIGLQACVGGLSGMHDVSTQTKWERKVATAVQVSPNETNDILIKHRGSADGSLPSTNDAVAKDQPSFEDLRNFLETVLPMVEYTLSQNETLNIYEDELSRLHDEDVAVVTGKGENVLKELRTFMDLQLSNDKSLVAIDWHPRVSRWLAASAVRHLGYDQWVQTSGQAHKYHVLVYTLTEFSSQIVLESPYPISCFQWNPTIPTLVAAGTLNGLILLYDVTVASDKLMRKGTSYDASEDHIDSNDPANPQSEREGVSTSTTSSSRAAVVQPLSITALDSSHHNAVVSIMWLPASCTMHPRQRHFLESDDGKSYQFLSAGSDGRCIVWDTRYKEQLRVSTRRRSVDNIHALTGNIVPAAGDLLLLPTPETPWQPIYECKSEMNGSAIQFTQVSWHTMQPNEPMIGVTQDGDIVCVDWAPKGQSNKLADYSISSSKDDADDDNDPSTQSKLDEHGQNADGFGDDTGNGKVLWSFPDHVRPGTTIQRSPFFDELFISIGEWKFSLWCRGLAVPIFESTLAAAPLTCGIWSPTRCALLFIGRQDGNIDIWDFTDTTLRPSMTLPVISTSVTSLQFRRTGPRAKISSAAEATSSTNSEISRANAEQLLAVGDAKGNLHVFEVPLALRRTGPLEHKLFRDIVKREMASVKWYSSRFHSRSLEFATSEKTIQEASAKREAAKVARENALNLLRSQLPNGDDLSVFELEGIESKRKKEEDQTAYEMFETQIIQELEGFSEEEDEHMISEQ